MWVEEDQTAYYCAGNLPVHLHESVNWTHNNVWIPDHVIVYTNVKRYTVFADIVRAAAAVIADPTSVHEDRGSEHYLYIFVNAQKLRDKGLLLSESTRYVDAVIEDRLDEHHCSTLSSITKASQLWRRTAMALKAETTYFEGFFAVHIIDRHYSAGVRDLPDERDWPFYFFYEDEKLARGEHEFVGLEVLDMSLITDEWLAELETLDLPRVDVPDAGLQDASIADVLRWARKTYPSRYEKATG